MRSGWPAAVAGLLALASPNIAPAWGHKADAARAEQAADRPDRPDSDNRPPAGMKAKVIQVKHLDTESLVHALRPLMSGVKGAALRESDDLHTVSVRDFPENVAAVEQVIKRLDVPTPPKPDVELRIRVLLGSPAAGPGQYPAELEAVVKQLASTLSYKSYHQVASITQRVRAGTDASGKGQLALGAPATDENSSGRFRFGVEKLSLPQQQGPGGAVVAIRRFKLELEGDSLGEAEVTTGLTLREGEKVVVGTGSLKNRAMIVVLSARLLRP